ncbi:MAG: pullulanase-type alpha-1,6-glucosidase [Chloroflexi bacterium]|nr:pullulanase-type alpha-1,6-glucosidase [Chloroflexota bacterium]
MNKSCCLKIIITSIFLSTFFSWLVPPILSQAQTSSCSEVTLHYRKLQEDYDGWGLHVWGETLEEVTWEAPLQPAGKDEYGIYWIVRMQEGSTALNYIVHKGDEKDPGPDQILEFTENGCEVWLVEGQESQFTNPETGIDALTPSLSESPSPDEHQVLLHYRQTKADYPGWGLHVWGPTAEEGVTWTEPLLPDGQDEYGIYWLVEMQEGALELNYIVHKGDIKDPGPDQNLEIELLGNEIWLIEGSGEQFTEPALAVEALTAAGVGDIKNKAQAHWLTEDTIAWPIEFGHLATYTLHYDPRGAIKVIESGLMGGEEILLEFIDDELSPKLAEKFPHLRHAIELKIPAAHLNEVPEILKGQYAISVTGPDGSILGATALQIPGVLDDLYANSDPLGVIWQGDRPQLNIWAPTAKTVSLHLFPDPDMNSQSQTHAMEYDPDSGIWKVTGEADWTNKYYLYEVNVFVRQVGTVVKNMVTDPYSLSLSTNSERSQIVSLDDPELKPDAWDTIRKPTYTAPEDIVLYELHIRDFSAADESLAENLRGTYMAFTNPDSVGMQHLSRIAESGITHVHLLPAFDIATIDENKGTWLDIDSAELSKLPPDSEEQQNAIAAIKDQDGYNWGYDPFHYTTPEGSYSTNPDGGNRIREFRQMVMALNQTGLRVVMDVVYNHTNASGQSEKSVLDKIVPGYYYRLDSNGNVATSTCCPNTASEHLMMERLMIDSLLTWVKDYKIDGFRFDLMGHHMLSNMENARSALDELTIENDGVDGKSIYLYGEGWNFGEVADNARGQNATQPNLGGSGIGSFNDRLRDAARGGNPFQGIQEQGFVTGLYTDPNELEKNPPESQLATLLDLKDQIRVSIAGNLADYPLINAEGIQITGSLANYNGQPAGYTQDPQENIVYIEAHDNETLFDAIQYKLPMNTSIEERVRVQNLGFDLVALSQGVPFYLAGGELLRSKSFDRDSYNSGDWYNQLDYTYSKNNWGIGLPPKEKNEANWELMRPYLVNPDLAPDSENILAALEHFQEILKIRHSSPLFRLQTKEEIINRLMFHNTGANQTPGLIVMSLVDDDLQLDPNYDSLVVVFNVDKQIQSFQIPKFQNLEYLLHPVQASSKDPVVKESHFDPASGTFSVPGRTTSVFVLLDQPSSPIMEETSIEQNTDTPTARATPKDIESQPSNYVWILIGIALIIVAVLTGIFRRRR